MNAILKRELNTLSRELDGYPDEALIWAHPAGVKNPAGSLALHLLGNTRHFIGAILGNSGYVRNREFEFSGTPVARAEIQRDIVTAITEIERTLADLSEETLNAIYPIEVGKTRLVTGLFLVHLTTHFSYHLGQIDYHRRLVTGNSEGIGAQSIQELLK
ncbi:MAG: DinB family protein [bacterium]|nr:DinB family protein [bacterium]